MKKTGLLLVLLLGWPLVAGAETMYVQVSKARVLSRASAFSKCKGTLAYRAKVDVVTKMGAYYKVRTKYGTGYLPKRSLVVQKPHYASKLKKNYVSSDEVALATKGFNEQVEAEYRKQHAQLPYDQLDRFEKRTTYKDPTATFKAFRKKGKLGEYGEGGGR